MKTLIVTFFLLVSHSLLSQSQSPFVFKVLANKGANLVKKGATGQEVSLKPGLNLMNEDQIIASVGAYIGLMHKSGKTIELRAAGVTKISDLERNLANTKRSVADKYASFVWQKMEEKEAVGEDNYRANMKATGAVERANNTAITALLPKTCGLLNTNATIRWNAIDSITGYQVSIKDIYEDDLMTVETASPYLILDINDNLLADQAIIIISIHAKDQPEINSSTYAIERISPELAEEYTASLAKLKSEINENSPLGQLILATYLEDQGLVIDAIAQYEKILSSNEAIDGFDQLYSEFLLRNGLMPIQDQ